MSQQEATRESGLAHRARITEPSAWTPGQIEPDGPWRISLSPAQVAELEGALAAVNGAGLALAEIDAGNFPLPGCAPVFERIRAGLRDGLGFSLLHGFPVEGHERGDIERMYWGFCAHLGLGLTQNSDGTLIHYVTEGHLRPNQGTRGVGNPGVVRMHVDLADCVTLLCIRQPAASPPSRVASSTAIHNEMLAREPELLERMYRGFIWDRQNEHGENETPTSAYRVPVFSEAGGVVSCRYNRNWMTRAAQRSGGFSDADEALLDLFDELADANSFEFAFKPGDIQFVNNYNVLHGRAPHPPAQSEEETRLLMRIWFNIDGLRPLFDDPIMRYGVLRHGKLGWTAKQLADGLDGRAHARRAEDFAPLAD
jgi:hypothetical protein